MYDAAEIQGTAQQVLHHCPHCQGRFEIHTETAAREIFCPLCGMGFDPVKVETIQYAEGTPVALSPVAGLETVAVMDKEEKLRVGTLLGQYRVEEFIGRGGMGAVYRATQTSLDRTVALKVLPRHMAEDSEFVERFRREARALAELNHPNIVAIFDRGEAEGHCFFAMEYVDGVSLRQRIQAKKLAPQEALALVPQLCEALEYAHGKGVIHRDIKPENILLDPSGRVKVADFGLARIVRGESAMRFDGLTRSDVMMGTVNYMAPEQRESAKDVDHRADIYSLGVVIYELLTGELPIGRFDPPSKKASIDIRIDGVVLQLLAKDREARFQRAGEVRTRIEDILSGRAPIPGESRSPFHQGLAKSAVLAAAFGVVFSLVGVSQFLNLTSSSQHAQGCMVFLVFGILALTTGVLGIPLPESRAEESLARRRKSLAFLFLAWGLLVWVMAIGPGVMQMPDPLFRERVAYAYFVGLVTPFVVATYLVSAHLWPREYHSSAYMMSGVVLVGAIVCGAIASEGKIAKTLAEAWLMVAKVFPILPAFCLLMASAGAQRLALQRGGASMSKQ